MVPEYYTWIYTTEMFLHYLEFQQLDNVYQLVLIARRSIYHAGARYIKRGVNEKGQSANFVETE